MSTRIEPGSPSLVWGGGGGGGAGAITAKYRITNNLTNLPGRSGGSKGNLDSGMVLIKVFSENTIFKSSKKHFLLAWYLGPSDTKFRGNWFLRRKCTAVLYKLQL